ncbi:PAS domain-containing sensor histidine kinase [bacterium]|nr:PAS domain-containing sensor histidine kinase [bacterium]
MSRETIQQRFRELQSYVGWTDLDAARVVMAAPLLEPHLPSIVDDFYAEIERHPDAQHVITEGAAQVERLKQTLIDWLRELLSGKYDEAYAARHWKVGYRHVAIGLSQIYTNMALSRMKKGLLRALRESWPGDEATLLNVVESLGTLLDMDLALIQEAYESEHNALLQRTERLATLGQVSGGIAHELRNPLNAIKTSVYFLSRAKNPAPEKTAEHLERITRQVDGANRVVTALSDFAKQPAATLSPFSLRECLDAVIATQPPPDNIALTISVADDLPKLMGDCEQLQIAFSNLLRNAADSIDDSGEIVVTAELQNGEVLISVRDTGCGISRDDLPRITEPLFSTKARGIGLGLAITKAILEKHGTGLSVESAPGEGTTFSLKLKAEA